MHSECVSNTLDNNQPQKQLISPGTEDNAEDNLVSDQKKS